MELEVCNLGDDLPEVPCVYFLMNDIELCYIGQTVNLKKRIPRQNVVFNSNIYLGDKLIIPNEFNMIYYFIVENIKERRKLETKLIHDYLPKWNYEGFYHKITLNCLHPSLRPNHVKED
jgi:excinuclease UvrABC nuclease subunit